MQRRRKFYNNCVCSYRIKHTATTKQSIVKYPTNFQIKQVKLTKNKKVGRFLGYDVFINPVEIWNFIRNLWRVECVFVHTCVQMCDGNKLAVYSHPPSIHQTPKFLFQFLVKQICCSYCFCCCVHEWKKKKKIKEILQIVVKQHNSNCTGDYSSQASASWIVSNNIIHLQHEFSKQVSLFGVMSLPPTLPSFQSFLIIFLSASWKPLPFFVCWWKNSKQRHHLFRYGLCSL